MAVMDSVTGAAIATVVVLGYVLIVQAMMAAIVLLCEFIVLRLRALWGVVATVERTAPEPAHVPEEPPQVQPYRLGGDLKW
jgi:MFS superfamily sulfate permease-like transporter